MNLLLGLMNAGIPVNRVAVIEIPDEIGTAIITLIVAVLGWLIGRKKNNNP